ncbi:MAG: sigma-70 family RNA polymerase sigma factor [Candidatus Pedobacter colombiensis]|uniref:Sigma-70 family RNA polymerase sigma factor n=1 Tax=Candidatus Pedobacter colombiensis TaxID=3121371 RepID=A0AAJ5W968_9SPHI|nr:sigma-70 family RNA polymerase sigma factor [Pedobacter sp.]WEK20214.1 MAG: sigma-70 family RNA polymerase sigma factor [Pedobacter sp.]
MIYSNFSDQELVASLKDGSEYAFEELYNQYKERLAGNLYKLLKSEELTREILQELFLKLWDTRAQIDPEKSFKSYLFKIAENMVIDYYRRAARDKVMRDKMVLASTEIYTHIEEQLFRKENAEMLQQAIELMPLQRRKVFILCKLEGKSYKEIELILGINAKTINSHLFQANKFLKQHFMSGSGKGLMVIVALILKGI